MKDFFISYNKADVQWAEWVAGTLEENGYTTVIQAWDFKPGNNFVVEMQQAILECERTIFILSPSYLASEYCQAEWASIFNGDAAGREGRLIPVRVADVRPTGLLASIIYIDLFDQTDEKAAEERLLRGVCRGGLPRKKSPYPLRREEGPAGGGEPAEAGEKVLVFQLEEPEGAEIPLETKSALREWYFSGDRGEVRVRIRDKRQEKYADYLAACNAQGRQRELTAEEEANYQFCAERVRRCRRESRVKEKAAEFFLNDRTMLPYLSLNNFYELLGFLQKILTYEYGRQKTWDPQDIQLDVFLTPEPKVQHGCLVVPVRAEAIGGRAGSRMQMDLYGLSVVELGLETAREIAAAFYLFLGEEQEVYHHDAFLQSPDARNLLKYRVGLH